MPETRTEGLSRALTLTLGGFGAASVAGGTVLATVASSPGTRAFGQQTAAWGAVDLAIAGLAAWRSAAHPVIRAARLRRTLLANAGLDVGYIAAGAAVAVLCPAPGGRVTPEQARGHGLAVVVQGLGLLALDLGFAARLRPSAQATG